MGKKSYFHILVFRSLTINKIWLSGLVGFKIGSLNILQIMFWEEDEIVQCHWSSRNSRCPHIHKLHNPNLNEILTPPSSLYCHCRTYIEGSSFIDRISCSLVSPVNRQRQSDGYQWCIISQKGSIGEHDLKFNFVGVKFWSSSNIKVCSCQIFLVKF